jgi:hypothetical protein
MGFKMIHSLFYITIYILYGSMTLPHKLVTKTPKKKWTKKSVTKTRKILFMSLNFRYFSLYSHCSAIQK